MKGEERLARSGQFALVYGRGSSWTSGPIVMKALPNGLTFSRYGLSVSRRVGNAVTRNLVKRWLREILRATQLPPGWDIIFIARPQAASAGYAGLKTVVGHLLARARILGPVPPDQGTAEASRSA